MKYIYLFIVIFVSATAHAQQLDYTVPFVNEEASLDLAVITNNGDYVILPKVSRLFGKIRWNTNKVIDISKDGKSLAYLSQRNNMINIFIKDISRNGGVSIQRTKRALLSDFSYSPDGKYICFSEKVNNENKIFRIDAEDGYVCRQITSGNDDFSPRYSSDMSKIFFVRYENKGSSVWSYDIARDEFSSYSSGMNAYPLDKDNAYLCSRMNGKYRSEIWKINYKTGKEECIISDPNKSFSTPTISPDGKWVLFVSSNRIQYSGGGVFSKKYHLNTDIFICKIDGSEMRQLTYHPADDLSPVWSKDCKYIYFVSRRGSNTLTPNVWRMNSGL